MVIWGKAIAACGGFPMIEVESENEEVSKDVQQAEDGMGKRERERDVYMVNVGRPCL